MGNGILNVSACDKATGKAEKITITNDKGRLSKEEIVKMGADADRFRSQDEIARKKVEGKNQLENYCFQMKRSVEEEKLAPHFTDEDKKTIADCAAEGLQFCESDPDSAEAFEKKQKELEARFNPIMIRVYQAAGPEAAGAAGGMPGGMPGGAGGAAPPDTPMDDLD